MAPRDFIRSAEAAAPAIGDRAISVGERIHRAVAVTHGTVGVNTNLGIVLLAAPIAEAASQLRTPCALETLIERVGAVLARLTVDDAARAFASIRLARPSGLGRAARHDVNEPAQATLREAMCEAAERDMIARQYCNGYADVIAVGLERLAAARGRGRDWRWTTTEVYLAFLARYPDSHVVRQFGREEAERVSAAALPHERAAMQAASGAVAERLMAWDGELKARGVNPGTSADLTVATLFWRFLCEPKVEDYPRRNGRRG